MEAIQKMGMTALLLDNLISCPCRPLSSSKMPPIPTICGIVPGTTVLEIVAVGDSSNHLQAQITILGIVEVIFDATDIKCLHEKVC